MTVDLFFTQSRRNPRCPISTLDTMETARNVCLIYTDVYISLVHLHWYIYHPFLQRKNGEPIRVLIHTCPLERVHACSCFVPFCHVHEQNSWAVGPDIKNTVPCRSIRWVRSALLTNLLL